VGRKLYVGHIIRPFNWAVKIGAKNLAVRTGALKNNSPLHFLLRRPWNLQLPQMLLVKGF